MSPVLSSDIPDEPAWIKKDSSIRVPKIQISQFTAILNKKNEDSDIFWSQASWDEFARELEVAAPLETRDTYFAELSNYLGTTYGYTPSPRPSPMSGMSIDPSSDIPSEYTQMLRRIEGNHHLSLNSRVVVNLDQLQLDEILRNFPLVTSATCKTLLGLFKLMLAAESNPVAGTVLRDTLEIYKKFPDHTLLAPKYFLTVADRIIMVTLWWFYRIGQVDNVAHFIESAGKYTLNSPIYRPASFKLAGLFVRYAQLAITLATFESDHDFIQRIEGHWVEVHTQFFTPSFTFAESRTAFQIYLRDRGLTSPLRYLNSIWGAVDPYTKSIPAWPHTDDSDYQWLTNEGHLFTTIPSGTLSDLEGIDVATAPPAAFQGGMPTPYWFTTPKEDPKKKSRLSSAKSIKTVSTAFSNRQSSSASVKLKNKTRRSSQIITKVKDLFSSKNRDTY
ncbi:hypothetical protein H4R33_001288 [Dimargaris cristalligena]|nr:hypothetical protein H4R33_001288 [Dimargaris cristalligena]